ncbi:hypothetical protein BC834DRAFT_831774 [Gloeopeniophorella convolvens]|nr:hypothetical protein BC834DRAFT_831774 [Gloeopeniophorella convolvens]
MVYFSLASLLRLQTALAGVLARPAPAAQAPQGLGAPVPFVNPTLAGGSLLDLRTDGFGEPLNVIISSLSSPWVLSDGGFLHFANAIGFGIECFGIHLGDPQAANLGDGHGYVNQTIELRQDFGNPDIGTCWESLVGGNHLRLFRQNGPGADTGALFLAVSQEENVVDGHHITADGYDLGRDKLAQDAAGITTFGGVTYSTVVENITGLIPPGSTGINAGIPIDGVVKLLTVTIVP